MSYELKDEDVTFAFTPEAIRKAWKVLHGTDLLIDDDTLRGAAHETVSSQWLDLVKQIVELAEDYEDAMVLQRMLREEWLASPEADTDP